MKKLISISSSAILGNEYPVGNYGKIRQLFTGLTGYDIMLEESRKDLVSMDNTTTRSGQAMSGALSDSIKKCLVLLFSK